MTPEDLRALAEAATPGPWVYDGRDKITDAQGFGVAYDADVEENARLIALAPELALLCAEMGGALESLALDPVYRHEPYSRIKGHPAGEELIARIGIARAALDSLEALEKP